MKRYRILLSLLLSLALMLGMAACAEAAGGSVTLRNLALNAWGEEIVFGPEATLSAALDEGSLKLHLETKYNDRTLTPATAEIREDGSVLFSIGNSGRVYSLSAEMLNSMLGIDEDTLASMALVEKYIDVFTALSSFRITDENQEAYLRTMDQLYSTLFATSAEEVSMEIDGNSYTMQSYSGDMSLASDIAMLDSMLNCEIPEYADLTRLMLDLIGMAEEESYASFADYFAAVSGVTADDPEYAEIMEAAILSGEYAWGSNGSGSANVLTLDAENEESTIHIGMTATADSLDAAKADRMDLEMTFGLADSGIMEVQFHMDGDAMTFRLTMDDETESSVDSITVICDAALSEGEIDSFSADVHSNSIDEYLEYDYILANDFILTSSGVKTDGLWKIDLDMANTEEYTEVYVDSEDESASEENEIYTYTTPYSFRYAETAEADGSITSAISLSAGEPESAIGLSFEVNVAKDAEIPSLSAEGAYELTEDTESTAYTMLASDFMALYADAMEMADDEGISQIIELYSAIYSTSESTEESYELYDDEEYDEEYVEYEDDSVDLSSLEEAAEIFGGELPVLTVPEEYFFVEGTASADYVDVYFQNEAEHIFNFYVVDFGMDMGSEDPTVTLNDGDTGCSYVEYMEGSNYILLWFDENFDATEVERIMACLSL